MAEGRAAVLTGASAGVRRDVVRNPGLPAEADCGSHGMFDAASHARDPWSWPSIRRSPVAGWER